MKRELLESIIKLQKIHDMDQVDRAVNHYSGCQFENLSFDEIEQIKTDCWNLISFHSQDKAWLIIGIVGLAYCHWFRNKIDCEDFYKYFSHWLEAMSPHVNFQEVGIRLYINSLKSYYPIQESLQIKHLHSDWGSVAYVN